MLKLLQKKQKPRVDRGPTGLTVLYPMNDPPLDCNLDIVAIHGLNGGSISTWTKDGKLWLQDFIPSTFPSARIMTFGYNANLLTDCASGRINDFANNLIALLIAKRQHSSEKRRPLLFISHSMGGIVLKRALTLVKIRYSGQDLSRSSAGLVFLATPHRGSNAASLAVMGTRLSKALQLGKSTTKAAHEIREFSTAVQDNHSDFVEISRQYQILSLFETKGYPGIGLIVDEWSSRMDIDNEQYKVGLSATHTDMCRFSSDSDGNYRILIDLLEMFVRQLMADSVVEEEALDQANRHVPQYVQSEGSQEARLRHSRGSKEPLSTINASNNMAVTNICIVSPRNELVASSHVSGTDKIHLTNRLPYFFESGFLFRVEELQMINNHFRTDKFKIPAFGIYGEGGVGKTQIVLRHICSEKSWKYKAIFWFHADTEDKLANECDAITVLLGLQEKRSSLEEGQRLFSLWLQHNNDWLLVFDNVDDMRMVAPYWPTSMDSEGYIIVTSRNPEIARAPLTMSTRIESFLIPEGTEMMLSELSSYTEDEKVVACEITKKLGGLPLAIHHMACFARDTSISLLETLRLYEEEEAMVVEAGVFFGQERTLATVWSLSISTLSDEALQILDTISLFDPDSIPTHLIEHFKAPKAMSLSSGLGNLGAHSIAMRHLISRSLVRKKGSRTSQTLSIHRLIQSAVRRHWSLDQKQSAFRKATFCIEQVYPRQINGQSMAKMYSECAKYNSHMLAVHKYFCQNKEQFTPTLDYAEILAHCGWYYYERAQLSTSMEILKTAEEICLRLLGREMSSVLGLVYNNMSCIYSVRRQRKENMAYIKLAICHREASISREHPEIQQLGISYMNYGNVLQSRSVMRLKDAEEYYEKALQIRENCPGGTPEGLELTLNAMGSFKFIAGDVKGAQPYIERAIALHPQLEGDTTFTLHTLYVWGDIQWAIGKHDESYATQLRCLEGMKKLEGESHWMTGVSYHKVGCVAHMLGRELEAIENLRAALKTFEAADCAPGFVPRTCLVLGKVLIERGQQLGDSSAISEGNSFKLRGGDLAFAITGQRDIMETTRDFDELVARSYR